MEIKKKTLEEYLREKFISPEMGKQHIVAMDNSVFPPDIIVCILARLPLKALFRFKSVCKAWRNLLSSTEFDRERRGQFSSYSRNQAFITESSYDPLSRSCYRTFSLLEIESDENKPRVLEHPLLETKDLDIVGCCDGLICMGNPFSKQESIVFWNPAMTNLFKVIRLPESVDVSVRGLASIGFGCDGERGDCKVVVISFFGSYDPTEVDVYSVNSDSWIKIEPGFAIYDCSPRSIVAVNGNPYWVVDVDETQYAKTISAKLGGVGNYEVLACLDVSKMELKTVPASSGDFCFSSAEHVLADWKGSLGALTCSRNRNNDMVESFNVWVFNDGENVWKKEHSFRVAIEVSLGEILNCSKNGKILGRRTSGELFAFDPETGWVKVYDVQPWSYTGNLVMYTYTETSTKIEGMQLVPANRGKRNTSVINGGASGVN
ncbi:hypothetical protein CASFOL_028009 [Castilleja foliolosa]|uniref:F-box domain-containing protein n=1 Tax=Castilleja foliolosa TaxID=1961234 RepID=A0ABD3CGE5_9LAMI